MSKGILFASVSPDADDPDTAGGDDHADKTWICRFCILRAVRARRIRGTEVSAQTTLPPTPTGFTRKILSQMDGPMPDYVTLVVEVNIDAGILVPRHTHPGIESGYVVSGGIELPIQGQPTLMLKPGDGFQVPVATPHAGAKNGDTKTMIVSTYVVEKGKPLASPA
jgi:quercetin dioxygenase-like cupin family protein